MTARRLTASVLLACSLTLTGCGGGSDTAVSGSSGGQGGGHNAGRSDTATQGNDADRAFLTGMKPHHQQAVEMSEIVLAAEPPAAVAEVAQQVKDAQAPEIEQIDQMLTDLGRSTDGGQHGSGHSAHGGSMSEQDLAALRDATGAESARLYLEAMIEHHRGAIEASETELADGEYAPARDLAKGIARAQAEEITRMKALLPRL